MPSATATLTAIMSLESPRPAPGKSLTVVLDAGIYVPSMGKAVIAALRFFNDQGLVFDENGALYFVTAKVAKMKKGVETLSDGWVETDYDLIGDIIQLIKIEGGKKSVKPKHHQPLVQVAGTVESGNPQAGYFQLTIPQWITADNSAFLPVKAQIPLESKWKDRSKVIPEKGGIASFVGHLTDVERDSQTDMPTRFVIEVSRHLDFLGRSSSHSSPSPNPSRRPGRTSSHSKLRFDLDDLDDLPPSPSPKGLGKRPARDDSADLSDDNEDLYAGPKRPRQGTEKEDEGPVHGSTGSSSSSLAAH